MAYFSWNESLATGIPQIDEQHKKLIGFVNELSEAMNQGKGKDILGKVLDELIDYTVYHFTLEEKAFNIYGYPNKAAHKAAHLDLIQTIHDFKARHTRGELVLTVKILPFLTEWVKSHIQREDMDYVPYLKGKNLDL